MNEATITLDEGDLDRARRIGAIRRAEDRDHVTSVKCSKRQSDADLDLLGAIGEVAFSKATGLPIRRETGGPAHGPDVGHWQVKTTDVSFGRILIPQHRAWRYEKNRRYMLVRYDRRATATVVGWAWGHEFIDRPECLDTKLPVPAYAPLRMRNPWVIPLGRLAKRYIEFGRRGDWTTAKWWGLVLDWLLIESDKYPFVGSDGKGWRRVE